MAAFALVGFLWSIAAFIKYNVDLRDVILNACDVVTIAVPPALPAAMTIGTEFAIERLKKSRLFQRGGWMEGGREVGRERGVWGGVRGK